MNALKITTIVIKSFYGNVKKIVAH